jgi:predicted HAD superfamily phosphohydrolase YqeG
MVAYFKALDVQTDQLAMVGDRLLTDIIYGHRARALTILTRNVLSTRGDNWIAKQASC